MRNFIKNWALPAAFGLLVVIVGALALDWYFTGLERDKQQARAKDVPPAAPEVSRAEKVVAEEDDPLAKQDRRLEQVRGFWNGMFAENGLKWDAGEFPHPTFAGGSEKAYGEFAWALLFFLDSYRFEVEGVLDTPLTYGKGHLLKEWTFRLLVSSFSNPDGFGDHCAYCRGKLLEHSVRMNDKK